MEEDLESQLENTQEEQKSNDMNDTFDSEGKPPKKGNKKIIFLVLLLLLIGGFGWWTQSLPKTQLWQSLPSGAGIIVGSSDIFTTWKSIHDSEWNTSFANSLSSTKQKIWDSPIGSNSILHFLLNDYPLLSGVYQTEKDGRAKIVVVDLGWKSKLTDHLRFLLGKKFTLEQEVLSGDKKMTVLKRGNTVYGVYYVYNNLLILSTHQTLAKRAFESMENGGELLELSEKDFNDEALLEVWMNPNAVYSLSEEYFVEPQLSLQGIGRIMGFQHWIWTKTGSGLTANIETSQRAFSLEPVWWMWSATSSSKELLSVIPKDITMASHWGMSSKIGERRAALLRANVAPWKPLEDRLGISIKEDFDSWVSDEAAWVKLLPSNLKGKDGEVMLLKTNNPALASEKLRTLNLKVESMTLERFSELKYRGFAIGYLGVENLLPRIYGEAFDRIKRPYYTVLGNAVAFSNHPLSLKRMIDAKLEKRTIDLDETTIPKSAMYFWGIGDALYQDLPLWIDKDGLSKLKSSEDLFSNVTSFEGVFSPRAKYLKASYFNITYGDKSENKVAFKKQLRKQQALDSREMNAYLDGVEMSQFKAFKIASPIKSDVDNMIKVKQNINQ
ncbi:hypothetical protein EI427_19875 [Flammeovirga pectinis]|uniref:DUF3352 domain-containing protein n=1 Tax=Flammeovirga pectinis TaxID=2494373 RepID=A0A3S9P871_9BACT|nr:hypothetical protein [Flammeovirga pectinis]AZQ64387.1 hypothetical protein EI427_19875 [Flammeovirga pectinis]